MGYKKTKILVIDDNPDNLITLKALLDESFPDAEIITSNSGEDGLRKAFKINPDIILLDILMPDMDGFSVCKKLKEDTVLSEIPVVFITALKGDKHRRIRALEVGAEAFLSKPIDETELTAQIRAMLKIREANKARRDESERLAELVEMKTFELLKELAERKKTEQNLKYATEKWEKTFNAIQDVIIITDSDRKIIQYNQALRNYLGQQNGNLKGKLCHDVIHGINETHDECPLVKMKKTGGRETTQMLIGKQIWEILVDPIKDDRGEITGSVHIMTDITRRKRAEERAEENDRLKTTFLTNLSHEIRTPMNGILGFTEILKNTDLTRENQLSIIDIIEKSGQRLFNLINDLIDISLIESGQVNINPENIDIKAECEILMNFFSTEASRKNLRLDFLPSDEKTSCNIYTDKTKLISILSNLIKNAIKFTKTGGVVFGYSQNDSIIEFYVEDTGMGIDPEKQEIIFERFVQADNQMSRGYEGAGLGLSICKAYVELLGGRISVTSEPGKGSLFHFYLPVDFSRYKDTYRAEQNELT